ncbi:MAG: leader peptidase (prepilin peptidase) / N-methyltransferase [Solirubrobacteraceae bacterium]|jgi:leader peptidase (prepilin peptidase)/N-methyltransferase|nr:leader peptidase (prepilin peptidase) / N-methyltransferase [Solirubrobacteraceae bacterium]
MLLAIFFAALGGLVIGSFANVLAGRVAAGGSVLTPGAQFSRRSQLVAASTALLFVAIVAVHHDDTARLVLGLVLVAFLVPLALIDLDMRLLPNKLTAPAAIAAIVLGTLLDPSGELERLIACVAGGGFFLLAALAYPRGMGMGDVKLAGVMGLFLGREVAAALFVGLVAGVVVGVAIMARKGTKEGRKTMVPFGPFLALGGVVAVLAGEALVDAYVGTL